MRFAKRTDHIFPSETVVHEAILAGHQAALRGHFADSFHILANALRMVKKMKQPELHARVLASLAVLYSERQERSRSVKTFEQALRLLDKTSDFYPNVLNNLASTYSAINELVKAHTCFELAREILEAKRPVPYGRLAMTLINISHLHFLERRYRIAEEITLQAISLIEEHRPDMAGKSRVYYYAAHHYTFTGDYKRAIEFCKKHLEAQSDWRSDPLTYLYCVGYSAISYAHIHDMEACRHYSDCFFELFEALPDDLQNHSGMIDIFGVLNNLTGMTEETLARLRNFVRLLPQRKRKQYLFGTYSNIGLTYLKNGMFEEALKMFALAIRDVKLWKMQISSAFSKLIMFQAYANLMLSKFTNQDWIHIVKSIELQNQLTRVSLAGCNEKQLANVKYLSAFVSTLFLSIVVSIPLSMNRLLKAYCMIEFNKNLANYGLKSDRNRWKRKHSRTNGEATKNIRKELAKISNSVSESLVSGKPIEKDGWENTVHRFDELLRSLGERLEQVELQSLPIELTTSELEDCLPSDTLVVDYYLESDINNTNKRYCAFVLKKHLARLEIAVVRLGSADEIDTTIKHYNQLLAPSDSLSCTECNDIARKISEYIIAPVLTNLQPDDRQFSKLLICPVGALSNLQFESLPSMGSTLVEQFDLQYSTNISSYIQTRPSVNAKSTVAVFADPSFTITYPKSETNHRLIELENILPEPLPELQQNSLSQLFSPLPASKLELERIIQASSEHRSKYRINAFVGRNATKEKLLSLRSPAIIHIATHGYFIPEQHVDSLVAEPVQALHVEVTTDFMLSGFARSGLVFAGTTEWFKMENGGITCPAMVLSAGEIEYSHQFCGVDLVFLSACNSGLGQVRATDSSIGIAQAFLKAGAKSVIAALRPIPDLICELGIAIFYRHLFAGKGKGEALNLMQRELTKRSRAMTGVVHPLLVTSFVLYGDDSPLTLLRDQEV